MELYLIRHGESEGNRFGTHNGWAPTPLTEKGRQQAGQTKPLVEGVRFDRILVSDVLRAWQTANIIFPGAEFVFCPLIREMNNTAMRGKTYQDMVELFPDLYPECLDRFDYSPLGWDCESGRRFTARAAGFLDMVARLDCERVCAVCHAGIIKAICAYVLGIPDHNPPMSCSNASVSVLRFKNGRWSLKAWNITPAAGEASSNWNA
ncbi:MAG: histidine phosphatase family protein [Clostridiales bacterium]|nr:histidine phosphatase family protein [Clostridiales bacterium]